uniref:ADAM10 endopeptidase n=1 Tax=Oopsacas minuta TaxID=111878 RepID=A0A2I5KCD9_9METZ|nr:ADAM17 [Oopsacas minuta]
MLEIQNFKISSMPAILQSILLLFLVLISTEQVVISRSGNNRISDTLDNFEPLDYNANELIRQHNAIKSTTQRMKHLGPQFSSILDEDEGHISFSFNAFGHIFNLKINQDSSSIHPNAEITVVSIEGRENSTYDPATQYTGRVLGDSGSYVHGHVLRSGVFDGIIHAFNSTFHIEPANRFVNDASFHSLLYRYSDMRQELRNITRCNYENNLNKLREKYWPDGAPGAEEEPDIIQPGGRRQKRAGAFLENPICPVYLAADHTFYQHIGANDEIQTINELITHLNEANQIYKRTDFDGDGQDNVAFTLAKVEVFTNPNIASYLFGNTEYKSSSDYLDTWSRYDQDSFCLAMLFGYREFDDGVLGLAWVAGTQKLGGICQKRVQISAGLRSLNTGLVTFLNFGQPTARGVTIVTVAHEWGHNFGSPHDPLESTLCSPGASGNPNGNYLMYARATDGTQVNNDKFSDCSISSIAPVLLAKSPACFLSTTAVCGNGLVEEGEDCDCGDVDSCQDICCQPGGTGEGECMFLPFAQCSPDVATGSVCCQANCSFVSAIEQKVCQPQTSCTSESQCNGMSATCPIPLNMPNGQTCSITQTCLEGQCTGSLCAMSVTHTVECQCTATDRLCDLCCMQPDQAETCISIDQLGEGFGKLYREAGRSCSNFEGYCSEDTPPECELVNNNNILDSLLDLFTLESAILFVDWLAQYWYIIVIVFIVIIVLAILLHFTYRRKKEDIKDLASNTLQRVHRGERPRGNRRQASHRVQKMLPQQALTRLKRLFPTVDLEILKDFMVTSRSEEKAVDRLLDAGFPIYMVDT